MIGDKHRAGFTLIELLVAVGVFILVVIIVSTIYTSTIGSQRRAFGKQDILDSSRYALETMARAIRQSTVDSVSATRLELENHPRKGDITYRLNNGRILENGDQITANNVTVESLEFIGQGIGTGDLHQSRVTIVMAVRSEREKPSEETLIYIQTTVTPRELEL
jgi:Tfp pilus assembly protein PilE